MTENEKRDLLAYLEDLTRVTEVQRELIDAVQASVRGVVTEYFDEEYKHV